MLSKQDNDVLCSVGPGTPMGELMRLYWVPVFMSGELASPDCPPVRLRILGENLIGFRTTS
ncbi:MAG TPA: phthalate 4,5-dioxygenase, partial [Dehalococcoidia bacterium]|nr:phthalate 4,5-dioxygenase [Dehalococcoidia bacterium]